ncbi:MAG: hypothetical protein GF401_20615 [Chitinivibrionales bacterium]|nr:hypothetical protein [Chitinivibrionales bacterium]
MKLSTHLTISAIISGGLYALFRSIPLSVASFLSGFLIDLDHCLDYVREYGWDFNIKKFFETFKEPAYKKIVIIFHGWEIVILLFLISWFSRWNPWILGVTAGVFQHLLLDQIFNIHSRYGYFLVWRMTRWFDIRQFLG